MFILFEYIRARTCTCGGGGLNNTHEVNNIHYYYMSSEYALTLKLTYPSFLLAIAISTAVVCVQNAPTATALCECLII